MYTSTGIYARPVFQAILLCGIAGVLVWKAGQAQSLGQHNPCVENARQLALATMLYAQDYDTLLPPMQAARFQKAVLPYAVIAGKRKQALTNGKVFDPIHIQRIEEDVDKGKVTAQDRGLFLCPVTKRRYSLNPKLSNQVAFYINIDSPISVKPIEDRSGYPEHAETTWLFRDASDHRDHLYTVVFADTHVERQKSPPGSSGSPMPPGK